MLGLAVAMTKYASAVVPEGKTVSVVAVDPSYPAVYVTPAVGPVNVLMSVAGTRTICCCALPIVSTKVVVIVPVMYGYVRTPGTEVFTDALDWLVIVDFSLREALAVTMGVSTRRVASVLVPVGRIVRVAVVDSP